MQFRDSQAQPLEQDHGNTVLQTPVPEDLPLAKSTARLAAEAAFSSTLVGPPTTQQPLIVYRRKRSASLGPSDSLQGGGDLNVSEARGPRVFRAVAPVIVGLPAPPVIPSSPPVQASEDRSGVEAAPRPSARAERLAYKRPSKVVRLLFASEAGQGAERVAADVEPFDPLPEERDAPAPDRWLALAATLEALELSVAELKRLQSLRFESTRHGGGWMQLERKTASIRKQLQACLSAPLASELHVR